MITLPLWLRRRSGGRSPEAACSFGLLAAYITRPGHGAIARVMGFGAGALLATASIQLTISARLHAGPVTALTFLLTGALVFSCVNAWLAREGGKNRKRCGECVRQENERDHPGNGLAIAIGTMIDAVPEGLVLGISVAHNLAPAAAVVAGFFLANVPESLSSSAGMCLAGGWGAVTQAR